MNVKLMVSHLTDAEAVMLESVISSQRRLSSIIGLAQTPQNNNVNYVLLVIDRQAR